MLRFYQCANFGGLRRWHHEKEMPAEIPMRRQDQLAFGLCRRQLFLAVYAGPGIQIPVFHAPVTR